MRALVAQALRDGAIGFATSKSMTHVGYEGRPVPSRAAAHAEIEALAACLGEAGHGVLQCTIGAGLFVEELGKIAHATRRPVSWTALLGDMLGPTGHRGVLERCAALQAEGARVFPQVSPRPLLFEFQFSAPFPFESMACFKPVSQADRAGKKAHLRRPCVPQACMGEQMRRWHQVVISACPHRARRSRSARSPTSRPSAASTRSIWCSISRSRRDLEARFRVGIFNTNDEIVAELLVAPRQHARALGRRRPRVAALRRRRADRRCSASGCARSACSRSRKRCDASPASPPTCSASAIAADSPSASPRDVAVFDPATVACAPVRRVHDFPAGADRLVADAIGVRAVIVEGTIVREDGRDAVDPRGALPGRVLRGS